MNHSKLFIIGFLFSIISWHQSCGFMGSNIEDKDILFSTLINTNWKDFESIHEMSEEEIRNTFITELTLHTNEDFKYLQSLNNIELSGLSLLYTFIKTAELRTETELKSMNISDLKETIIVENSKHLETLTINNQENLRVLKLVQLAYSWYLPVKYASLINSDSGKISKINSDPSTYKFRLINDVNHNMHVLKIVVTGEVSSDSYKYLGVYHISSDTDNNLNTDDHNLQLAGSNDLFNWTFIKELDHDAHQGDIVKWNNGYLIAFEEDKTHGKNNIALRYYNSYTDLIHNHFSFSKSIQTSLINFGVEGTPDIRNFSGDSPTNGIIQIGFHYYDGNIDRLGMGILKNGNSWTAWKDVLSEYNLREMNFKGNIGSRKKFIYNDEELTLQEARFDKRDWSTWKILLGLNGYYTEVLISTPNGSSSFTNPSITPIENNKYVITLFVPTEASEKVKNKYIDNGENGGGAIYIK